MEHPADWLTHAPPYPKLRPEVKTAWLAALRSGEYPQSRRNLRDEQGFCCLGVRNELAVNAGVIAPPVFVNAGNGMGPHDCYAYAGASGLSSQTEMEWAYGAEKGADTVSFMRADEEAASLNDNGADFMQIADWIEANL